MIHSLSDQPFLVALFRLCHGTRTYLHCGTRTILADAFSPGNSPRAWNQQNHLSESFPRRRRTSQGWWRRHSGRRFWRREHQSRRSTTFLSLDKLRRVLAQVEVSFSNSLIEAWWRSLKHGWLYLHPLDSFAVLEKLIAFYVQQHNAVVPMQPSPGKTTRRDVFRTWRASARRTSANRACAGPRCSHERPTEN